MLGSLLATITGTAGKSIKDAAIRTNTGASVVGVIHENVFLANPKAEYSFHDGDWVAVVGNPQERNEFKKLAGIY